LQLRETTGQVKDLDYRHGPKPMIADTLKNHKFFEEHKDKTLMQLCDLWFEKTGQRMTTVSMSRSLKRLGYTRKKRAIVIKNEMNQNEALFLNS
jgi:transposase